MALFGRQKGELNLAAGVPTIPGDPARNRSVLVVVLVAILFFAGAVAMWQAVQVASQRSQDAFRWSQAAAIHGALYRYFVDHNSYPVGAGIALGEGTDCSGQPCRALTEDGFGSVLGGAAYLAPITDDQLASDAFRYTQQQDGADFVLHFTIRRGDQAHPSGSYAITATGIRLTQQ